MDDDEGLVEAHRHRVRDGCLGDVEFHVFFPIERGFHIGQHAVKPGELLGAHLHGVCLEDQADSLFATDESENLLDGRVEPRDGPEALKRRSVRRVLPAHGGDACQDLAWSVGRNAGHVCASKSRVRGGN